MQRAVLGRFIDIVTEEEALYGILEAPDHHVPFIGAGVSKEAGVMLAEEICQDIRQRLERPYGQDTSDLLRRLNWHDPARRYGSCLEAYGPPEARVDYFRRLLKGRHPAFAHHALTLLMANDKLYRNALTTNFDKLIEQSFFELNIRECQAIRMREEAEFWGPETDKCYLLKLHGDYDTHNILNTRDETRLIPAFFEDLTRDVLLSRGLFALGSAGNEDSICKFLEKLLDARELRLLSRGVRWGVYVGSRKPENLSESESADLVAQAIENGGLNRKLLEILSTPRTANRPCSLFPVWGSGRFLMSLIEGISDQDLIYRARMLMDHEMRVASLFRNTGLPAPAVEKHLERLNRARRSLEAQVPDPSAAPQGVISFTMASQVSVDIVYGDIVSQKLLYSNPEEASRRAIVSTDDTMISAGGGVALSILTAAGAQFLLNEIGKLAPIPQGTIAVTSAGELPLAYIFHSAALRIDDQGEYQVTAQSVRSVMNDALSKARALGVKFIYLPLIAAGTAGLSATESLEAILQAADKFQAVPDEFRLVIVILNEISLSRAMISEIVEPWQWESDPNAE
jgi:O-acetyl-ADP-ribose deacetylase (regulator of RNase III)